MKDLTQGPIPKHLVSMSIPMGIGMLLQTLYYFVDLYFVARRNDMIKTRSANVSRLEVEAALNALPDVAMALVTGLDDALFGQVVAAAVLPAPGASPSAESLRAALREEISSYKVPRLIVFLTSEEEVPRTATGKIKLHELGELILRNSSKEKSA